MSKIALSALKPAQVLPAMTLGLFTARVGYELDPLRLAFLGDWPGTLVFTLVIAAIACYALRVTRYSFSLTPFLLLSLYIFWPDTNLRLALILFLGSIGLAVAHDARPAHARLFALGFAASVFVMYLATLGDHVGRADTFEFQVVAPQLGIAHPTGYPLFILLGKLFSLLPLGSMALRVNLLSALSATLAVLLIYRLILSLTADRLVAALAALMLAASSVFWSQSVVAEVYALNALFVAIISILLVRLTNDQLPNDHLTIYSLAFVFGLALTHHLTAVILTPAIGLTLLLAKPRLSIKSWLIAIGLFLLGLTPWLYIPLRWPALHNGVPMALSDWAGWIFGLRFGGALNLALWSDATRWNIISRITLEQFGPIGALVAALGLIVLLKRSWRMALITLVIFAGYIFYGLVYNVPDVDVFIIPAFMMMAVWAGVAMGFAAEWIESKRQEARSGGQEAAGQGQGARNTVHASRLTSHVLGITRYSSSRSIPVELITRYSLLIVSSLLPLTLIANNFAAVNQRGVDADWEAWGRYALSLPIPDRAALLVDSEKIAPLYYLQVTEHLRPDLDILVLGDEALYRQELDRRVAAGQAVYLARFLPNLPYRLRSLGPLVEVSTQPMTATSSINRSIGATFGADIDLLGVKEEPGDPYRITLYWQAISPERRNYHVRLRLVDAHRTVWWEDRGAHPVSGYYPTGAWAQGEIVPDFHEIKVEPYVPAGEYDLEVGLFTPFRDDGLRLDNGSTWWDVATVQVAPHAAGALAREVRIIAGNAAVTSVEAVGEVPPSSEVALRVEAVGSDVPLNVVVSIGQLTASQSLHVGQSRLTLRAPDANGAYPLQLKFDSPARCHWLASLTNECEIGSIDVAGEAIGTALNFDNQVLLTSARIDRDTLRPNETIHVDLTWRGLKAWDADYTVFVHLIGPDGKVHGQADQWPVQGTLPTSSWSAGQTVSDPYAIVLPPDAPSGQYQIEVGWYLLATLRRLPVLDAAGRPSDDKVIVGEFVVP